MEVWVLQRMSSQIAVWDATNDRRSNFLRCYRLMSANMLEGIEKGRFLDEIWVNRLLHRFADYYFEALYLYELQHPNTPKIWQETHDLVRYRHMHILQDLLLGINAHINYDLALALCDVLQTEWRGLSEKQRQRRLEDHRRVNSIIAATIDEVQDNIIEPQAPRMETLDRLMGRVDEWLLSRLITRWRQGVWKYAGQLLDAPAPGAREQVRQRLEKQAQRRAQKILNIF